MNKTATPTAARPSSATIDLLDTGARLHLDEQVVDDRSWWSRFTSKRRHAAKAAAPVAPMPGHDHDLFPCPSCGEPGRTDIHDRMSGRRYLSCSSCYKMWQVTVAPTLVYDESWAMR